MWVLWACAKGEGSTAAFKHSGCDVLVVQPLRTPLAVQQARAAVKPAEWGHALHRC